MNKKVIKLVLSLVFFSSLTLPTGLPPTTANIPLKSVASTLSVWHDFGNMPLQKVAVNLFRPHTYAQAAKAAWRYDNGLVIGVSTVALTFAAFYGYKYANNWWSTRAVLKDFEAEALRPYHDKDEDKDKQPCFNEQKALLPFIEEQKRTLKADTKRMEALIALRAVRQELQPKTRTYAQRDNLKSQGDNKDQFDEAHKKYVDQLLTQAEYKAIKNKFAEIKQASKN